VLRSFVLSFALAVCLSLHVFPRTPDRLVDLAIFCFIASFFFLVLLGRRELCCLSFAFLFEINFGFQYVLYRVMWMPSFWLDVLMIKTTV
jgi:hypothetical protein